MLQVYLFLTLLLILCFNTTGSGDWFELPQDENYSVTGIDPRYA